MATHESARRRRLVRPAVSRSTGPEVRRLFGLAVTAASETEAVRLLDDRLDRGETIRLAFLNAHASNLARQRPDFQAALADHLLFNDGIGVDIAARVLDGEAFPANLNGTDFVPRFLIETRHRFRLFLLGASEGVAEAAAAKLLALAPQHHLAGCRNGYFPAEDAGDVADEIAASGADLLLVALGNPAQELFIHRYAKRAGCRMAVAVGGLFDFMAEAKPRAPLALRRAGLEWAFRLAIEPKRMWKRYVLGNPAFLAQVAQDWAATRLRR